MIIPSTPWLTHQYSPLPNTDRDLGMILSNSYLSWSIITTTISAAVHTVLYILFTTFFPQLYLFLKNILTCPWFALMHLTYCSQIWRPRLHKDILEISNILCNYKYIISLTPKIQIETSFSTVARSEQCNCSLLVCMHSILFLRTYHNLIMGLFINVTTTARVMLTVML